MNAGGGLRVCIAGVHNSGGEGNRVLRTQYSREGAEAYVSARNKQRLCSSWNQFEPFLLSVLLHIFLLMNVLEVLKKPNGFIKD